MNRAAIGLFLVVVFGCSPATDMPSTISDSEIAKRAAARQLLDAAIREASNISDPDKRAEAYLKIADVQMKLGDKAAVRTSIKQAKAAIGRISKDAPDHLYSVLCHNVALARAQAWCGDMAKATETVSKIQDKYGKAAAYCGVAEVQLDKGNVAAARKTLALADDALSSGTTTSYYSTVNTVCVDIADVWARTGDIAGAKDFVERIPGGLFAQVLGYGCIAEAQAKAGDVAAAYRTVELMRTANQKMQGDYRGIFSNLRICETYANIAQAQVKASDISGAQSTLARLQDAVENDSLNQEKKFADLMEDLVLLARLHLFLEIASTKTKVDNLVEARKNIEAAKAIVGKLNSQDQKTFSLLAIGELQQTIGDYEGVRKSLAAAKTAASKIEAKGAHDRHANYYKVAVYRAIISVQAKAGDKAGASKTLEIIQAIISRFPDEDSNYKSFGYRDIAHIQAESGDLDGAKATVAKIESSDDRISAFQSIVEAQAESAIPSRPFSIALTCCQTPSIDANA